MKNSVSTTDVVREIVLPVCEQMNLNLWDVTFEKEGSEWFLKVLVEKKDGSIDINECEAFSRAIDPLIDEADPIDQSYYLEVGSPGLNRKLRLEEHFKRYIGEEILVRLIRPLEDKRREFGGILKEYSKDSIVVAQDEGDIKIMLSDTAFVKLCDD